MDYKLQKIRLRRGGSYIKSLEWLLYKRPTINLKNEKDDKCFQYALTLALNYNEIKKKELNKKIRIFYHKKETRKIWNKKMSQSLLMSYFHRKIMKKQRLHINQNIILNIKTKCFR